MNIDIVTPPSKILPPPKIILEKLPEWVLLENLVAELGKHGRVHHLGFAESKEWKMPLTALSFGNQNPEAPVLALFGGIHGLERIGCQVVLSLMHSFSELLTWDEFLSLALQKMRIIFFPMVNPLGMLMKSRSNANGVDLMRNSPVEASLVTVPLLGGHRISPKLPWYRGELNKNMEIEAQAVFDFCKSQFFKSKSVISVDFHSGFGMVDRLWFPYAKSKLPFPNIGEMMALKESLDRTYPNHIYTVEPQSKSYTTHGDLWDHTYDEYRKENDGIFLALSLEMGSWSWVKKNPRQIFSSLGAFNPIAPHRTKRILRRHHTLFDFLIRSLVSRSSWMMCDLEQRKLNHARGMELWYG